MSSHQPTTPPPLDRPTDPPPADQPTPPPPPAAGLPLHPYHRLHHDPITQQPQRGETGWVTYARDLARAVCAAAGGSRWDAEATSPAFPTREVDQHSQITITIDDRRQVVFTQTNPAGSRPELWTITIDGQPIPHRPHLGEAPHHVTPLARSVWYHLNGVRIDPCDKPTCHQPATVATWGSTTCFAHAPARPPATRPAPSAAPAPPLASPNRSTPPHAQPKGMRR